MSSSSSSPRRRPAPASLRVPSVLLLMGAAPATLAQSPAPADPRLEQVVVTATRTPTPVENLSVPVIVIGREEMRAAALEAARRAVELGPELAGSHVALGLALSLTQDHAAAEQEFETALGLDPRLFEAHYFYARTSFMQGDVDKAMKLYEEASALRPEDYQSPLLLGQLYEDHRQPVKAEASRRRGLKAAEARLALHPDDVRALYMGAHALVGLGERERGLEWAQRAFELDPGDAMLLYNLACIYAMAGRGEEALDFLERSARAGMNRPAWLRNDSNLDSIRGHARFEAVVRQLEAQQASD